MKFNCGMRSQLLRAQNRIENSQKLKMKFSRLRFLTNVHLMQDQRATQGSVPCRISVRKGKK